MGSERWGGESIDNLQNGCQEKPHGAHQLSATHGDNNKKPRGNKEFPARPRCTV